ncbi:MAG: 2-oxoacid:ferredoxin oxidoreductase subunit beta [Gammaproteobacteria bacterium]|nr:2-oxoacid:ferredoxin oxidoreductase subunit beta [Gammaproteobacteria bacterium]
MNIQAEPIALTRQDYLSDCDPKWCPGCGCFAILRSMTSMFAEAKIPTKDQVIISGIGCSSRLPYYSATYGFHTIHGRAPTVAMGAKLANPDLSVWIVTGDGDALAIGGNHTTHLLRRNSDVKMMLLNNEIYGLTKGQASPTTPQGLITKSSPYGAIDKPIRPVLMALAAGATFVARVHDKDVKQMENVMLEAQNHKGAVFIEILMNCVTFHDGAYETVTSKKTRSEHMLELEHGEPLIYGEDNNKGFINVDGKLESVVIGENGITEDDILIHDAHSKNAGLAAQLSLLGFPHNPYPIGIFRNVDEPVYGEVG